MQFLSFYYDFVVQLKHVRTLFLFLLQIKHVDCVRRRDGFIKYEYNVRSGDTHRALTFNRTKRICSNDLQLTDLALMITRLCHFDVDPSLSTSISSRYLVSLTISHYPDEHILFAHQSALIKYTPSQSSK